jgi:hypothetical protein
MESGESTLSFRSPSFLSLRRLKFQQPTRRVFQDSMLPSGMVCGRLGERPKTLLQSSIGRSYTLSPIPRCGNGLPITARKYHRPTSKTPDALGDLQRAEIEKWWPIIKAAKIKGE